MATVSKNQKMNRMNNFMEELAESVLDEILAKKRSDFSAQALSDIKALALNRLWPMYTTTDAGKDYLRKVVKEENIDKDVARELRAAMDIVRSNPR
jgi:hypothetical protein